MGVDGEIRGKGYAEITQHYPRPGWVEHDPGEIWSAVETSARQALDAASAKPSDVAPPLPANTAIAFLGAATE